MKRTALLLGILFAIAVIFSSCRTQRQACAAYSSIEQPVSPDSNS